MTISAFRLETYSTNPNRDGTKAINFLVTASTITYPLFDDLTISRGKLKGHLKFTLQEFDYTKEDIRRKVKWKLTNARKEGGKPILGHISKISAISQGRYIGDVKGTKDKILVTANDDLSVIHLFIVLDAKSDYTLIDEFGDGDMIDQLHQSKDKMTPWPIAWPE